MAETYYKNVNGVTMEMTEDEIADLLAQQEAADLDFSVVRGQRNSLLSSSDWTRVDDNSLSDEKKAEWATYRQELRDLPAGFSKVSEVVFPTPPE